MEFLYLVAALVTAGVSLASGLTNLSAGSYKERKKKDLIFGIMSLCLLVSVLLPPIGFPQEAKTAFKWQIDAKAFFYFSFYALLPWFVQLFARQKTRLIPVVIDVLAVTYFVAYLTNGAAVMSASLFLGLNLVYGIYVALTQSNGERKQRRFLLLAFSLFAISFLLIVANQFSGQYLETITGISPFSPLNFFPVSFLIIMGMCLRIESLDKFTSEKMLRRRDARRNSLIENMNLLIAELDKSGQIKYLNAYAIKVLGQQSSSDVIGRNWFDVFTHREDAEKNKSDYLQKMRKGDLIHLGNTIVTKNGLELLVNWSSDLTHDEESKINGTVHIGLVIVDKDKIFEGIELLKTSIGQEDLHLNENRSTEEEPGMVGNSQAFIYAIQKARQVAPTNAIVLLEGETGVGKELFADLIHQYSYRKNKPFIKINCAALPPELIESELFGHEKGAFTGALQTRKGRFELAQGGAIFLDEIGELPLHLQPKLLRVLENGEFERIGGQETIKVDVRVISATNRNLLSEVQRSHFREDLYYRLNVFPITIPPLRNRREDIPSLVRHFVSKFSKEHNRQIESISKQDMIRLIEYAWPGNIRELINVLERSVISSQGNALKMDSLSAFPSTGSSSFLSSTTYIEQVERAHIVKVLNECSWKISGDDGAAVKLGLNPSTLRSRLKKLNITRSEA